MLQPGVIVLVILLLSVSVILLAALQKLKNSQARRKRLKQILEEKNKECEALRTRIISDTKKWEKTERTLTEDTVQYFEEELQHIGAEIHDDLIQRLGLHRLTLERLYLTHDIDELQALGLRLKSQFEEIVKTVRRISKRVLPDDLVEGSFTNSIKGLCVQMETTRLILHVEGIGKEAPIPPNHALQLYRIVQELIHNARKHSLAWHLWVRIDWRNGLVIQLEDDGQVHNIDQAINDLFSFRTIRLRALKTGSQISFSKAKSGMLITVKYNVENSGGVIGIK